MAGHAKQLMERRKLAVGYFYNAPFQEICAKHLDRIREIFFAWPGVLSCRPAPDFTPEVKERLFADLNWARANGIELDTLFNANCYGDQAISTTLADFVRRNIDEMCEKGLSPDCVTTTSPFIAKVLRKHYPNIKIRWSVNIRVHGTVGFESVLDLFDSFYISREIQRDIKKVAEVSAWAKANNKMLGMQANSGCLRQCPFQTFHDNLHGHGDGRRPEDIAASSKYDFSFFLCKTRYSQGNEEDFLRATWLRPEDMREYEKYVDIVKLATRRHPDPEAIINAYATCDYDGNLALLMDPAHTFAKSFDNKSFDRPSSLWHHVRDCPQANDCKHCGKCKKLLEEVYR